MKRRWKVLLCGYYGMGNLGDELLAAAGIELLEGCGVARDEIVMLSGDVSASGSMHKICAFDRWDLRRVYSSLRESESLLLGGGGIFQDSSSFRSPAYYWGIVRAAKFCGCKVWAVGQSVGPLSHFLNRALTRDAFARCEAVSVRDRHSFEFLAGCHLRAGDVVLTDDLALSRAANVEASAKEDVFLVNFRRTRDKYEYEAAKAVKGLSAAHVVGVAMDRSDAQTMEDLARSGLVKFDEIVTPTINDVEKIFSRARGGFGMRLHFGVMCLRAGIPFSMAAYDPKVTDFARRFGVPLLNDGEIFTEKQESREKQENREPGINAPPLFAPRNFAGEAYARSLYGEEIRKNIRTSFFACYKKVFPARDS